MELASGVVQALTEQVFSVGARQVHYASDLRSQFDHLKQTLEHVNGLLGDKKNVLKLRADGIKPVLIPLRKLIYEADDVITDCMLRDEYNDGGIYALLQKCNVKFLLETGKKLKGINDLLDEQLGNLKRFLELKKDLEVVTSEANSKDESKNNNEEEDLMSQDFNPDKVIGIDDDIKKIKSWILEPGKLELHRVAVTGMGGLGKTTVVQKIYNDADIPRCFDTKIWVRVSKNFSKYKILKSILAKLIGGRLSELQPTAYLGELRKAVKKKRGCLVVMDDVWSIDDINWWQSLCSTFDAPNQRNCIIVTTRNKEVAKLVVRGDESRMHEPRKLNKDESWSLFSRFAFPRPEFEGKGREIVKKCGGLPLSIKTTGGLLATKHKLSEWTDVLDSFHGSEITSNDQVIESLRFSYNELEGHLKLCLLCFSIYPEDSEISAEQVIHWWVAEGLLQKRDSKKSMVDLGHEYLSVLTSRCLVEVEKRRPYDGRVYSCMIHDMVREMLMKIAEEEGFCSFNEQGIMRWSDQDPYWLCLTVDVIRERDSTRREEDRILEDQDDNEAFLENDDAIDQKNDQGTSKGKRLFEKNSKLRALLLMTNRSIDLNKSSGSLLSLRMLDLSGGSISQLDQKRLKNLLDWIGALTRLACLNLSELEGLEELPSSICELRNLQLLVLKGCSNLKKVPEKIAKLKKLIVLHLGNCPRLEYLPRDLEKLSNLQELNGLRVTIGRAKSKAIFGLSELRNLTQLRVLQIVISSDNEAEISEKTEPWNKILSGLKKLKTLDIDTNNFNNGSIMLDRLSPPGCLKELYLRNYHSDKLPLWINPSRLSELQYLCIEDADYVTEWITPHNVEWKALEGLRLKDMKILNADWLEMKKAMKALQYLEVIECNNLKNLPEMTSNVWRAIRKRA